MVNSVFSSQIVLFLYWTYKFLAMQMLFLLFLCWRVEMFCFSLFQNVWKHLYQYLLILVRTAHSTSQCNVTVFVWSSAGCYMFARLPAKTLDDPVSIDSMQNLIRCDKLSCLSCERYSLMLQPYHCYWRFCIPKSQIIS